MNNSRALAAALIGAGIGGVAGYLFFTEHGRRVRLQIEPAIDEIARELMSFRTTLQKATGTASEGWKMLNEALGETAPAPGYPGRQTSPF